MNYIENFSLDNCTTFHLPVKCDYFIEYETVEELLEILKSDIYNCNKSFHIGGGSNLVFTNDYHGVIIHSKINYIDKIAENEDSISLKVGAGVDWDKFVLYCVENDYYGVENLSYIPGEVGASAVQNIGSYGAEVKDVIEKVYCIEKSNGNQRIFINGECNYDYRDSIFKNELKDRYIVVAVGFKLSKQRQFCLEYGPLKQLTEDTTSMLTLSKVRQTIIDVRKSKLPDPNVLGSAGSFFKNPIILKNQFLKLQENYPNIPHYIITEDTIKVPAGWLIENTGLKGFSIGGARVYEKQCLV
ncbi:MAG: UDP-N-acetylmuramate dehydrogenase, partial [Muribaculaceae bacterium]